MRAKASRFCRACTLTPNPLPVLDRCVFLAVFEMSQILNTGLTREQLAILVELCELGANPEALAAVVSEMRREAEALAQDSVGASSRV